MTFPRLIGLFLWGFASAALATESEPPSAACGPLFAQVAKTTEAPSATAALQDSIRAKLGPNALYRPVFSKDTRFVEEEILMAESPAPQKNMRIVPGPEQFRVPAEAEAIFLEKKRLMARNPKKIVQVLHGQESTMHQAVLEQFQLILNELPGRAPTHYRREGDTLINLLTGDRTSAAELQRMTARKALAKLGELVPDDLIFMKKFGDEYRVVGGNLAFPTHWDLDSTRGLSIQEMHALLPGSKESRAKFSAMINGALDRTLAAPESTVLRNNWFLEEDPRYALPGYLTSAYPFRKSPTSRNYRDALFFRCERHTLRGLPGSKTVVFAINPHVFPLREILAKRPLAKRLAEGLRTKFSSVPEDTRWANRLAGYIEKDLGAGAVKFESKAASLQPLTSQTSLLRIERPGNLQLAPGEAVNVTLETPSGRQTRTLSLASSPDAPHLEFATNASDSDFKKAFNSLAPGAKVEIELLRTSLNFQQDKPAVMIAGGIGITPFRSFIQFAKDKGLATPMWLFYGNRTEIPFGEELAAAAEGTRNFQLTNVLSRPGSSWEGAKGRIDKDFLAKTVPDLPKDAQYYVVGSPQMTADTQRALRELGVSDSQISVEVFPGASASSARNPPIDAAKAPACEKVCFCRSVTAGAIRKAIADGASSLDDVKKATGATTGCGGCIQNVMNFLTCGPQPGR